MKLKKSLSLLTAFWMLCAMTSCNEKNSSSLLESSENQESTTINSEVSTVTTTDSPTMTTTSTAEQITPQDENAITFDTPSLYSAHTMEAEGEAQIELAVVNFEGDFKLRVHANRTDESNDFGKAKIVFDLPALIGIDNTGKVDHISMDFSCVARGKFQTDEENVKQVIGHFNGTVGSNIATPTGDNDTWREHEFKFEDMENSVNTWHFETKSPSNASDKYADNDKGVNLVITRFEQPNDVDFYIDNITFYDKDGKSIPILYDVSIDKTDVVNDRRTILPPEDPADIDDLDNATLPADLPEETTTTETEPIHHGIDSDGNIIIG